MPPSAPGVRCGVGFIHREDFAAEILVLQQRLPTGDGVLGTATVG